MQKVALVNCTTH